MNPSDTTAVNPRDDGSRKADRMDDTNKPYQISEPKTVPETNPGPDTRQEPYSPK